MRPSSIRLYKDLLKPSCINCKYLLVYPYDNLLVNSKCSKFLIEVKNILMLFWRLLARFDTTQWQIFQKNFNI